MTKESTITKKRAHVYYGGRVQGVGFRYTAEFLAQELNLTGWVKNMEDGGVELVVEGREDLVKEFLDKIKAKMRLYIYDESIEWQPHKGEFKDFDIRFY